MVEYTPKPTRSRWHDEQRRKALWPDTKEPEAPDLPDEPKKETNVRRGRWDDIVEKHANRVGVDPTWLKKIMKIESGGNPANTTGSYKGLFQLSDKEFKAGGGSGNIYDPEQNTMAAANKLAREKLQFQQKYGREATLKDIYMIHQQGEGGFAAHMNNPNQPAWQSMLSTGEGRRKGEAWAKKAIWGNIPDQDKAKFGSVDNITSQQFMDYWGKRIEGTSFESYGPFKAASGKKDEGVAPVSRGTFQEGPEKKPDLDIPEVKPTDVSIGGVESPSFGLPGVPQIRPTSRPPEILRHADRARK